MSISSARHNRVEWWKKPAPENYRILYSEALDHYGNANRLAKILGITRSAVYQWRPPYRYDPYIPEEHAKVLIERDPIWKLATVKERIKARKMGEQLETNKKRKAGSSG